MLKVPSVDEQVEYWTTQHGGIVTHFSKSNSGNDDDGTKYKSAFVVLGNGQTTNYCFALELVQISQDHFDLGDIIENIGVSRLAQFQNGQKPSKTLGGGASLASAPHGLPVKSCPSAPGDYFCRLCLYTHDLDATQYFYCNVLGMQVAAADETQVCLRYPQDSNKDSAASPDGASFGVLTMLVFTRTQTKSGQPLLLKKGTCWDQLAIRTTADILAFYQCLCNHTDDKKAAINTVFMKPTPMFGVNVMDLLDPNGYKVVLAGPLGARQQE